MENDTFSFLSPAQRQILNFNEGNIVVKACPGSGKTFSVAARIARLLGENQFGRRGIATLSFTNVACVEIAEKLKLDFKVNLFGNDPHFLGTIDSFINQYIFLPFGHLVMGCSRRPELVGKPYSTWNVGKGERKYVRVGGQMICRYADSDEYFDCTSFDINDRLVPIVPYQNFHFSWRKYFNIDGSVFKPIREIIDSKERLFNLGYANQADANYHALRILERYPLIAQNIANKFEYFIIDEAQDTDEIQMSIIELLSKNGAENIMLVGDRDQSIFEWNDAMPELFDRKYDEWEKIELIENRRSSQKICNVIQTLSSFDRLIAVDESIKNYDHLPEVLGFKWPDKRKRISEQDSKLSMLPLLQYFCATCEQHGIEITKSNVAVLYRGNSNAKYINVQRDIYEFDRIPWSGGNYHVRDIVRGKFLYENGQVIEGYRLMEKGYFEALNKATNPDFYCSSSFINTQIEKRGLKEHRIEVFKFINCLPSIEENTLMQWVNKSNEQLLPMKLRLSVIRNNANVLVHELFAGDLVSDDVHPFYFGSIHSAKGKTFEAIMLILGKKPGNRSYYRTILKDGPKPGEAEELRNIYVALSRPRRILVMAVPEEDVMIWKKKLKIV